MIKELCRAVLIILVGILGEIALVVGALMAIIHVGALYTRDKYSIKIPLWVLDILWVFIVPFAFVKYLFTRFVAKKHIYTINNNTKELDEKYSQYLVLFQNMINKIDKIIDRIIDKI